MMEEYNDDDLMAELDELEAEQDCMDLACNAPASMAMPVQALAKRQASISEDKDQIALEAMMEGNNSSDFD